jgi:hypothetical protein
MSSNNNHSLQLDLCSLPLLKVAWNSTRSAAEVAASAASDAASYILPDSGDKGPSTPPNELSSINPDATLTPTSTSSSNSSTESSPARDEKVVLRGSDVASPVRYTREYRDAPTHYTEVRDETPKSENHAKIMQASSIDRSEKAVSMPNVPHGAGIGESGQQSVVKYGQTERRLEQWVEVPRQ